LLLLARRLVSFFDLLDLEATDFFECDLDGFLFGAANPVVISTADNAATSTLFIKVPLSPLALLDFSSNPQYYTVVFPVLVPVPGKISRILKLSIVIVNWNTASFLRDCLGSLAKCQVTGGFETIVVDNNSRDDSVRVVRDEFPDVILLEEKANHGYALGNNLGIAKATGEFILTLNSDTVLSEAVLEKAIHRLESMPSYGCLSVQLIGTDRKPQRSVRGFPSVAGIFGDITGLGKVLPALDSYRLTRFDYETSQDAPQPMGTFLLFRGSVLKEIPGPFDEQFPIFFNEVDLLKQMQQKGYKCWYEASISIKHFGGESTKQVKKSMIWESHRSLIRYFSKNLKGLARISLPFLSLAIWLGAFWRAKGFHEGFRP